MLIRPATAADIAIIEAIALANDEPLVLPAGSSPGYLEHLLARGTVLVAEADGGVRAFGAAVDLPDGSRHLADLFVEPRHQGRGLGRALAARLLEGAAARTTFASGRPSGARALRHGPACRPRGRSSTSRSWVPRRRIWPEAAASPRGRSLPRRRRRSRRCSVGATGPRMATTGPAAPAPSRWSSGRSRSRPAWRASATAMGGRGLRLVRLVTARRGRPGAGRRGGDPVRGCARRERLAPPRGPGSPPDPCGAPRGRGADHRSRHVHDVGAGPGGPPPRLPGSGASVGSGPGSGGGTGGGHPAGPEGQTSRRLNSSSAARHAARARSPWRTIHGSTRVDASIVIAIP